MKITKNGFVAFEWNGLSREYVDRPIKHIYHELRGACGIDPDVTLKDIVLMVGRDKHLHELIEHYSWCDVQAFVDEIQKPCAKQSDLKYIDISRTITIEGAFRSLPERISDSIDVHGVDDKGKTWSISFVPVNEMAHCIVRAIPKVKIRDWRNIEVDHGETIVTEAQSYFPTLEILGEIFYAISFHGSPKQTAQKGAELKLIADEVKSGKGKTVPFKFDEEIIQ